MSDTPKWQILDALPDPGWVPRIDRLWLDFDAEHRQAWPGDFLPAPRPVSEDPGSRTAKLLARFGGVILGLGCPKAPDHEAKTTAAEVASPILAGFLAWEDLTVPGGSLLAPRPARVILALMVAAPWRRQGLGRALVDRLTQGMAEENHPGHPGGLAGGFDTHRRLELSVWEFNHQALAFWQAMGFRCRSRRLELG